ncbi:MAG: hypothetical protein GY832_00645 [Chloroflexi bacterium]|nr:hypothetical protein [Chloroflexota bacterium]
MDVFETDWLASQPVFYNEKTGKVSHNINDVIDPSNLEFDPEGFNNFLDFGYSVFQQTPIRHVKFLRHSTRLTVKKGQAPVIEYLDDPVDKCLDRRFSEDDIFDLMRTKIWDWERSCQGEIVIPTSGGFDSRLLNLLVEDKSRIRSFSFGLTQKQSDSKEVVHAKRLSEILGTKWQHIRLGDYHQYVDYWEKLFGVSTHTHGMYQIEFYHKVCQIQANTPLLSGIIGDAWAGSVVIPPLSSPADVQYLGYTHGASADSSMSQFRSRADRQEDYFDTHKERLKDPRLRIVEAMRIKLLLLTYLMLIPASLGFKPWSPYLDIEVAMAMLNLPPERKHNRIWQREFFRKNSIDLDSMSLRLKRYNSLNHYALRRIPLKSLDEKLLAEVVKPEYVRRINHLLARNSLLDWLWEPNRIFKSGNVMRRLGFREPRMKAYFEHLVLYPIEALLKKRNQGNEQ